MAQIVFDAFGSIDYHRFTETFQRGSRSRDDQRLGRPPPVGVVAERGGRIVGSSFLDERDPIKVWASIRSNSQNSGVGRRLMEAVVGRGKDAAGIRLLPGRVSCDRSRSIRRWAST